MISYSREDLNPSVPSALTMLTMESEPLGVC